MGFWAILCWLHARVLLVDGLWAAACLWESRPPGGGVRRSQAGRGRRVLLGSTWASPLSTFC